MARRRSKALLGKKNLDLFRCTQDFAAKVILDA